MRKLLNISQDVFIKLFALKSEITFERKNKITWDEFFSMLVDIVQGKGIKSKYDIDEAILKALKDEKKKKIILDVLNGNVKIFRYVNIYPSWLEFLKKVKEFEYTKDELISELIHDWYIEASQYAKGI
jgi:hypothetical protein